MFGFTQHATDFAKWGTLDTVTVTGGELVVTLTGGTNPNWHAAADAVRIARVAQAGGASMRLAGVDPFYDPLETRSMIWPVSGQRHPRMKRASSGASDTIPPSLANV